MSNSSTKFEKRYGTPPFRSDYNPGSEGDKKYLAALVKFEDAFMISYDIPADINQAFQCLPNKLYCNKDLVAPFQQTMYDLIKFYQSGKMGKLDSLITFDGCYNIRKKRGLGSLSLHSWAAAVDVNAFRNGLGQTPTFSDAFAKVWEKNGFIWGGRWNRKDGMHFEINIDLIK